MNCRVKKFLFVLSGVILLAFLMYSGNGIFAKGKGKGSKDRDRDGLTNRQERLIGTNPRAPDTDNDGLDDGTEVFIRDTDPDDPDSDDDGIDDFDDDNDNPIESEEFETSLVPTGTSSIISTIKKGEVKIEGESGNNVKVELHIKEARDATGNLVTDSGDTLSIDATLDGTPTPPLVINFNLVDGKVHVEQTFAIGSAGQSLRINSVGLTDSSGAPFATPGVIIGGDDGNDNDNDNDNGNGNDNTNDNENSNSNS